MSALIVVILGFLGIAYFTESGAGTQQRTPTIGVLTLMHHPALDQIYAGYVKELAREGYHNGKNIKIDYQNAQGDQANLKTMATKLTNEHPTILLGITTPAAQALANTTNRIPIILGAVTNPQTAGLVKHNRHPGGNITGVSDQAPVTEQLKLVKQFMPHAKRFGIIYTSSDASAVAEHTVFVREARRLHMPLKSYSIANSNDLNQVSQEMLTQVDAVIVPTDNTIAGAMQTLVKNADAVNKPIFPTADSMVKAGGVAAYGINQARLGEVAAKMTVAVLKGKQPGTMPIRYLRQRDPVLNLKQAQRLGLKVPPAFQRQAEQEGKVFR